MNQNNNRVIFFDEESGKLIENYYEYVIDLDTHREYFLSHKSHNPDVIDKIYTDYDFDIYKTELEILTNSLNENNGTIIGETMCELYDISELSKYKMENRIQNKLAICHFFEGNINIRRQYIPELKNKIIKARIVLQKKYIKLIQKNNNYLSSNILQSNLYSEVPIYNRSYIETLFFSSNIMKNLSFTDPYYVTILQRKLPNLHPYSLNEYKSMFSYIDYQIKVFYFSYIFDQNYPFNYQDYKKTILSNNKEYKSFYLEQLSHQISLKHNKFHDFKKILRNFINYKEKSVYNFSSSIYTRNKEDFLQFVDLLFKIKHIEYIAGKSSLNVSLKEVLYYLAPSLSFILDILKNNVPRVHTLSLNGFRGNKPNFKYFFVKSDYKSTILHTNFVNRNILNNYIHISNNIKFTQDDLYNLDCFVCSTINSPNKLDYLGISFLLGMFLTTNLDSTLRDYCSKFYEEYTKSYNPNNRFMNLEFNRHKNILSFCFTKLSELPDILTYAYLKYGNKKVVKCQHENCNNYFIPKNNHQKYCDLLFPSVYIEKTEDLLTCKEYHSLYKKGYDSKYTTINQKFLDQKKKIEDKCDSSRLSSYFSGEKAIFAHCTKKNAQKAISNPTKFPNQSIAKECTQIIETWMHYIVYAQLELNKFNNLYSLCRVKNDKKYPVTSEEYEKLYNIFYDITKKKKTTYRLFEPITEYSLVNLLDLPEILTLHKTYKNSFNYVPMKAIEIDLLILKTIDSIMSTFKQCKENEYNFTHKNSTFIIPSCEIYVPENIEDIRGKLFQDYSELLEESQEDGDINNFPLFFIIMSRMLYIEDQFYSKYDVKEIYKEVSPEIQR